MLEKATIPCYIVTFSCLDLQLDNSRSDLRNLIGQLQVSKLGRNLVQGVIEKKPQGGQK